MNNEQNQLKAFVAFLFIFSMMALSQAAFASYSAMPSVPGYNATAGTYRAASGAYSMAAANAGFIQPSVTNVAGRAVTMPATLRMAANAGQAVLGGLRITPMGLLSAAALGYLASGGITPDQYGNPQFEEVPSGSLTVGLVYPSNWSAGVCSAPLGSSASYRTNGGGTETRVRQFGSPGAGFSQIEPCYDGSGSYRKIDPAACTYVSVPSYACAAPQFRPAQPGDYDALPDPLPVLAPELPHAPYLPDGVPVTAPEFSPSRQPIGDPYERPDGSTAQPWAVVTPNAPGQGVTIDTYDQPLTDASGQPVPNAPPVDTSEPTPQEDPCTTNPNRIGCSEYGTIPAPDLIPETTVPVNPNYSAIGGNGTCPNPVVAGPITWSYQPFCDFASAIRPFVIGFAWLSFAFIVVGAVRT
ncbi:virulence factor TspB C-terminal domain-related protein [Thiobacillus sp.]|uniref:virulence factor TspB C-terminal domain-related protein n=1 Tax=Thiobacillus sp. TaxID=924 RepID=UPI00286E1B39|nr:virulence factor TspB C-terminal domain-related protein [Thiobacillus sp.]